MYASKLWKGSAAVFAALLLSVVLFAGPAAARNGFDFDVRGGMYTNTDAPAVGGGLLMNIGEGSSWYFNPNVELAFRSHDTETALSGDVHYDFPIAGDLSPYVGAGPSIRFRNGTSEAGLNVLGGIAGTHGDVRPFGQLKAVFGNNNEVALMGGVRFR